MTATGPRWYVLKSKIAVEISRHAEYRTRASARKGRSKPQIGQAESVAADIEKRTDFI